MNKRYGGVVRAGVIAALVSVSGVLGAADNPADIIKYRQNVMKAIGGNAGASAAILENKVAFKDRLDEHARALAAATRNIPALFPPGSDTGAKTRALEAIWTKRAEFEKRAMDAQEKAAAFAKAVASNDETQMRAAFKELNGTCRGCHRDFRQKD